MVLACESGPSDPLENGLEASPAVAGKCAIFDLENETLSAGSHSFNKREQSVPAFISFHSVGQITMVRMREVAKIHSIGAASWHKQM
ncbi:hypothetical protein MGYG_05503 [Nannizzia gypsea CBS 118893]|uniref:Uncharacterized protein n=1 Tax=Arthroderma gypseum (strain ATCC MYA-4604 / CBS 118893) TaxID=535722 RepID=E4UWB3_ARTGP|nr:hypothetical protein MGYG_05503 [Nannizzia gypsea CBS 118893]EFR02508.1 hypothetical protein MGYG_05503 [Nannizzia gypsea CBS 118893]